MLLINLIYISLIIAAGDHCVTMDKNNLFKYVFERDSKRKERDKSYSIIVFKIKEGKEINYYLTPRNNYMNRSFRESIDFLKFEKFKSFEKMISYIKRNNIYGYKVYDGNFYLSKNSFDGYGILRKIPLQFTTQELNDISTLNKEEH